MKIKPLLAALDIALCTVQSIAAQAVDEALPLYQPVSGVSGNLSSVGSDTLLI